MFSSCLPRSEYTEVRSKLRRIRRAAGPARDLDVLEERLSRLAAAGGTTVQLGAAIDQVRRRRKKAGKPLLKTYKKARRSDFEGLARSLPTQVAWRGDGPEPVLIDWAGIELRPSIEGFMSRSSSNLTDREALHRMRIAEKRVRYSLEILGGEAAGSAVDRGRSGSQRAAGEAWRHQRPRSGAGAADSMARQVERRRSARGVLPPCRVRKVAGQLRSRRVLEVVDSLTQPRALRSARRYPQEGFGADGRGEGVPAGRLDRAAAAGIAEVCLVSVRPELARVKPRCPRADQLPLSAARFHRYRPVARHTTTNNASMMGK